MVLLLVFVSILITFWILCFIKIGKQTDQLFENYLITEVCSEYPYQPNPS